MKNYIILMMISFASFSQDVIMATDMRYSVDDDHSEYRAELKIVDDDHLELDGDLYAVGWKQRVGRDRFIFITMRVNRKPLGFIIMMDSTQNAVYLVRYKGTKITKFYKSTYHEKEAN